MHVSAADILLSADSAGRSWAFTPSVHWPDVGDAPEPDGGQLLVFIGIDLDKVRSE